MTLPMNTLDQPLSGTGDATISTMGCNVLTLETSDTWTGSLYVEGCYGTNWELVETLTANATKKYEISGYRRMRVRADLTGGTSVNVQLTSMNTGGAVTSGGGSGSTVADQGKAGVEKWLTSDTDAKGVLDNMYARQADGNQKTQISGSVAITHANLDVALSTLAKAATQTDGTQKTRVVDASGNTHPAMDTAARRGFVTHTDGTNSMPTGDAVGRGIHVRMGDGITVTAVKAASTAAVAGDTSTVVQLSPNQPSTVTLGARLSDTIFNQFARVIPGVGALAAMDRVLDFGDRFCAINSLGGTDSLLWTATQTNGSAGQGNGDYGVFQCFGNANSTAKLKSKLYHSPKPGTVSAWYAIVKRTYAATANHQMIMGPYDDSSPTLGNFRGYRIKLVNTTWTVEYQSNTTSWSSSAINGTAPTIDNAWHLYEVVFAGNGAVYFLQDGVIFHTMTTVTNNRPDVYALPMCFETTNPATGFINAENDILDCGFVRYGGGEFGGSRWRSYRTTANETKMLKPGPTEAGEVVVAAVGTAQTIQFFDGKDGSAPALTGAIPLTAGQVLDLSKLHSQHGLAYTTASSAGTPDLTVSFR